MSVPPTVLLRPGVREGVFADGGRRNKPPDAVSSPDAQTAPRSFTGQTVGMDTHSPHLPSGAPSRRRRLLAALALAIPLALTACGGGGDDEATADRTAYQPGSTPSASAPASPEASASESASEAPSEKASETPKAKPSSAEPTAAETTAEEPAETQAPAEPSAAPAAAEACVGSDYNFTDLSGDIGCYDAKVAVENVLNNGQEMGGGVSDSSVKCTPQGASWQCSQLGDTAYTITVQAKSPAHDPLQDLLEGSSSPAAEPAALTCSGSAYDFSGVQGMSCQEALVILDPFVDRRAPEGSFGGAQCYMEKAGSTEVWSCSRDSGGSFTARSR